MAMLEMTKTVLSRVSFDKHLFKKEFIKALKWLRNEEKLQLRTWVLATFAGTHKEVIIEVFDRFTMG